MHIPGITIKEGSAKNYRDLILQLKASKQLQGWEEALVNDLTNERQLNQAALDLLDSLEVKYL